MIMKANKHVWIAFQFLLILADGLDMFGLIAFTPTIQRLALGFLVVAWFEDFDVPCWSCLQCFAISGPMTWKIILRKLSPRLLLERSNPSM